MRKSAAAFFKTTPTRKLVRKSLSRQDLRTLTEKVTLEKVFGLTTTNTNGLASNPHTGIIAYPAGCVVVLYDPKTTRQRHLFNPDKKTITCVSFSIDGKYLVTGESGQQPSVRVWELNEQLSQVAELRGHKSGITSVAFSPDQKLIVSIGDQHDMLVNVWNWKLGHTVACNKSGCRVRAFSFSENGNYLVTVGNRHVKFWYLDEASSKSTTSSTTPISGRSGILGDQRNNCFTDVQCGVGKCSQLTYCVTKSGLLCMFSGKRILEKWVELKAGSTNCLAITSGYIFCGCSDGVIRVFEPLGLKFVTTLPKPHPMGVNVTEGITSNDLIKANGDKNSPDLVAMTINEVTHKLTCVYNDHSLYIWDVRDIRKVGKTASFLYHSACIWGVETYPYFEDSSASLLPYSSFLTCSSDDTIRIWNFDKGVTTSKAYPRNLYSKDLLKVVYIDEDLTNLQDTSMAPFGKDPDNKNGVRCMQISPSGQLLATGDRSGNLRIYDLQFFDESLRIEAHESEILCVEFSSIQSGYQLLASASRDRLIHIFDVDRQFALLQTIDDHSSSITAVRFNYDDGNMQLLSCGADKVVMFHTAQFQNGRDIIFVRNTIVPGKATLYDMGIEPTRKYAATVGQDRNLRIYDIQGAKQLQCYKGSVSEEGNLIKFQLDDSGVYAAVSCSDKTIAIFDFETGECEAAIYGHSELVTGLKFTPDGKRLISVAGDGCIFVWSLPSTFTETIRHRLRELNLPSPNVSEDLMKDNDELRRKTFLVPSTSDSFQVGHDIPENASTISSHKSPVGYRFSVGQLPSWAQKQMGSGDPFNSNKATSQPLGRWAEKNDLLTTVPEHAQKLSSTTNMGSQESLISLSSDRSCFEDNSSENDVVYPESNDDIINIERTFQVTETLKRIHPRASSNKDSDVQPLQGHNILNSEIEWLENEIESENEDDDVIAEPESDEEAGEALLDHFEKLGTPVANIPAKSAAAMIRERSSSASSNESDPSIPATMRRSHRASISAKFLSRSQRARALSSSSSHVDEQKRRFETVNKLRAKFMSSSSTNVQSTNRPACITQTPRTPTHQKHRRSIDMTNISSVFKSNTRSSSESSSNLKKSKMYSQSCQNLSMTPFTANHHIPSSPQHSPSYDPRRSSTPMFANINTNKDDKKNKRKTIGNAWNNPSLSPVSSPSPSKTSFLRSKAAKNLNASDSFTRKQRPRPRSLMLESVTQNELRNQLRAVQAHSDDEGEYGFSFITKDMLSDKTPVKEHCQHLDTSTPTKHDRTPAATPVKTTSEILAQLGRVEEAKPPLSNKEVSAERVRQVAEEIDAQVRAQKESQNNSRTKIIVKFDTPNQVKAQPSTPPERDLPTFQTSQTDIDSDSVESREIAKEKPNDHATEDVQPLIEAVSMDECQSAMRSLVQSYSSAQKLLTRVLNDSQSENQTKLLGVISRTYTAIEENMSEQRIKVDKTLDMSSKLSPIQESELFKELEKSLSNNGASSLEVLTILDQYSNVLVDMIASKVKKRETLIE